MIYLKINEILEEKNKTKYWFVKRMERRLSSTFSHDE